MIRVNLLRLFVKPVSISRYEAPDRVMLRRKLGEGRYLTLTIRSYPFSSGKSMGPLPSEVYMGDCHVYPDHWRVSRLGRWQEVSLPHKCGLPAHCTHSWCKENRGRRA